MAEYKESHVVKSEGEPSRVSPWLTFFLGALLVAAIAIFFMNAQGSYSGPGGRVDFNIKSQVTEPANPAPAPTPKR